MTTIEQYRELERQSVALDAQLRAVHEQLWHEAKAFTHPHKPTRARIQNRLEEQTRNIRADARDEYYKQGMYADPPDPRPAGQRWPPLT